MVSTSARLTVLRAASAAVPGVPFDADLAPDEVHDEVRRWCESRGWKVVSVEPLRSGLSRFRVRQHLEGADPVADLSPERRPGSRLWLYTNFHCNLQCDYCCVSSSPRSSRRLLDIGTMTRLAEEAAELGVGNLFLTGGEPFLRPDIADVIGRCARSVATTVLTNGMLFAGKRREWLDACPRENVTLQISLDSAGPELHDLHRGAGSHRSALRGIRVARELGFRTCVAATVDADARDDADRFLRLCSDLGIAESDRILRRIARQGEATEGLVISRKSVIPEICVTAEGVWWHPVGATDPSLKVFDGIPPLSQIVAAVTEEFVSYRLETEMLAASFPCA